MLAEKRRTDARRNSGSTWTKTREIASFGGGRDFCAQRSSSSIVVKRFSPHRRQIEQKCYKQLDRDYKQKYKYEQNRSAKSVKSRLYTAASWHDRATFVCRAVCSRRHRRLYAAARGASSRSRSNGRSTTAAALQLYTQREARARARVCNTSAGEARARANVNKQRARAHHVGAKPSMRRRASTAAAVAAAAALVALARARAPVAAIIRWPAGRRRTD